MATRSKFKPHDSALARAAQTGDLDALQRHIHSGGPKKPDANGKTALMWAAIRGHAECVDFLLPFSDATVQDYEGKSALMWAAVRGHTECARLLLPHCDPNETEWGTGRRPLLLAALGHFIETVELLLPHGDPNHVDLRFHQTALTAAFWKPTTPYLALEVLPDGPIPGGGRDFCREPDARMRTIHLLALASDLSLRVDGLRTIRDVWAHQFPGDPGYLDAYVESQRDRDAIEAVLAASTPQPARRRSRL